MARITRSIGYGWGTQLTGDFSGRAEVTAPVAPAVIDSAGYVNEAFAADMRPLRSKPGRGEQEFNRSVARIVRRSGFDALRQARAARAAQQAVRMQLQATRVLAAQQAALLKNQRELLAHLKKAA